MSTSPEHDRKIAVMTFSSVYPHYLTKVEKKGRSKEELNEVIQWLTGFDEVKISHFITNEATFEEFFSEARIHPNAQLIAGSICGYKIQDIQTPLTKQVRYLDKLVDELAKGKKMEKILR